MDRIKDILGKAKVIAVVGASLDECSASFPITKYLITRGFGVYPVNPKYAGEEISGVKFLASLSDIKEKIDIIDVFRRSEAIPGMVDDFLAVRPGVVWFQLGIYAPDSFKILEENGIEVIYDRCIYKELMEC
ncbi:MAG TPA: CoA-binding protein [Caldisericia bacterium]|nr:CoA-binding protein [Caldisericia bacterium]